MHRSRWILASLLTGPIAACLSGCGGKDKADNFEPPPAVASNPPVPKVEPPVVPKVGDAPAPLPMAPMGVPSVGPVPLPQVPSPFFPGPKDPLLVPKDPPNPFVPPPMPPAPDKPMPDKPILDKDKPFEWPTTLYGRPMSEYIKDIYDNDPAIREMGLRTVPGFGPVARPAATKAVLSRMNGVNETDPGVRAAAFEAIGAFAQFSADGGLDSEAETTEAIRILLLSLQAGGATRLHAVNTLASFSSRAAGAIPTLIGLDMASRSGPTRRAGPSPPRWVRSRSSRIRGRVPVRCTASRMSSFTIRVRRCGSRPINRSSRWARPSCRRLPVSPSCR